MYLVGTIQFFLWTIAAHHAHATSETVGLEMKNVRGAFWKEVALFLARGSCKFLFPLAFLFC